MKLFVILSVAWCLGTPTLRAASQVQAYRDEPPAARDARLRWFREARFGMFIHWGLYSVAAGEWDGKPTSGAGEWIQADLKIPASQYQKLVPQFNPTKFDARQWVRIAKAAGMKYIVITTKHHDGFAIYPSKLTDWCIKSTPFKRDPLKELSIACEEEGIRLCFYHSIMDWHHPDYPRPAWNDLATGQPDVDRYEVFLRGQLNELLTNYGPIGIVWFDGNWENAWNYDRGLALYNYVRSLQPQTIVNNRVGQDKKGVAGTGQGQEPIGDYGTPEQSIPAAGMGAGVDWETCMTMNDTWGFKKSDQNWKSTQTLVRNLIDIASKGGNYLLNVGPTGEGLIPDASVERLEQIGRWMNINAEAIYATTASPFAKQLPWGRCSKRVDEDGATTLYLHVFDWPASGELLVPGLKNADAKAWLLADEKRAALATSMNEGGLRIALPNAAPNSISSTVVVQMKQPPVIEPVLIAQAADGSIHLPAADATLHGNRLQYEVGGPLDDIGFWTDPNDWAAWDFKVRAPGAFTVVGVIAAPASGAFNIAGRDRTISCTSPATANFTDFKLAILGKITIPQAGKATLSVHPAQAGWKPMNLKSLTLIPAAAAQ